MQIIHKLFNRDFIQQNKILDANLACHSHFDWWYLLLVKETTMKLQLFAESVGNSEQSLILSRFNRTTTNKHKRFLYPFDNCFALSRKKSKTENCAVRRLKCNRGCNAATTKNKRMASRRLSHVFRWSFEFEKCSSQHKNYCQYVRIFQRIQRQMPFLSTEWIGH